MSGISFAIINEELYQLIVDDSFNCIDILLFRAFSIKLHNKSDYGVYWKDICRQIGFKIDSVCKKCFKSFADLFSLREHNCGFSFVDGKYTPDNHSEEWLKENMIDYLNEKYPEGIHKEGLIIRFFGKYYKTNCDANGKCIELQEK